MCGAMTKRDLSECKNPDMRGSMDAMRRAAAMARQIAIDTDTGIVLFRDGKVVHISAADLREERDRTAALKEKIAVNRSVKSV